MSKQKHSHNEASRKFHDRVASRYDAIYDDDFWDFHDRLTWSHLKPYLPKDLHAAVLDLGTGTGKWGLKLLKAGYPTTFSDLSNNMLGEVRDKLAAWAAQPDLASKAARATVQAADAIDLACFGDGQFELITAMGDVVSICADPARCLSEMRRILKPGGMAVFTVDNYFAALDHFADSGSLEDLASFIKTGKTHWLTKSKDEQFTVHMFKPKEIEALVEARGMEVLSQIGKTVIPARKNRRFFEKEGAIDTLVDLEMRLWKDPTAAARASHLQLAVRRGV